MRWGEALGDGSVASVGVEGAGSYGADLSPFLLSEGVRVFEADRPNRRHRRAFGKSDTTDAAVRTVLAGTAKGFPKGADDEVEAIRAPRVAQRSAMKAGRGQSTSSRR